MLKTICFEGCDGSGKTTMVKNLSNYLTARGKDHEVFSFPTQKARQQLKSFDSLLKADKIILSNLYLDDYCDVIDELNERNEDKIYVFDRSPLSTIVYQCVNDPSVRPYIHSQIQKLEMPMVMFYLEVTAKIANERLNARNIDREEYEKEELIEKCIKLYDEEVDHISSRVYRLRTDINDFTIQKNCDDIFDFALTNLL